MVHFTFSSHHEDGMAALDQYVAPGLRLWMLIGLVSSVLLIMVIIVCCFMRIRIPRTKREIELNAAQRKMRKAALSGAGANNGGLTCVGNSSSGVNNYSSHGVYQAEDDRQRKNQTIVMHSNKHGLQNQHGTVKKEPLPSRSINV